MKQSFGNIEVGYEIEAKGESQKCIQQVHGSTLVEYQTSLIPEADAVFTRTSHQSIHIYTADCIPLLLFSRDKNSPILAAHCGWRGALHRIGAKSRQLLTGDGEVIIGPSIHSCCFEVKEDFVEAFRKEGHSPENFLENRKGKLYFDLVKFVTDTQLKGLKLHTEWSRCTFCSLPQLPSYRRNKGTDPQIRSWIVKH